MPEKNRAVKQVGPFAVVRSYHTVQVVGHERLVAMKEYSTKLRAHAEWLKLSDPATMLRFMGANSVNR
jgi:hypothetical protein